MFAYIYEWIQNLAFYMILMTVLLQVVPGENYRKYIRFFAGMILILLLASPMVKLFGMEEDFRDFYQTAVEEQEGQEREYEQELERIYQELQ